MKKISLLLLAAGLMLASCKKEDKCPYSDSGRSASVDERTYIESYLSANSIPATPHPSGVFYFITAAGTGASPGLCSGINVRYRGTIMNTGAEFDATAGNSTVSFQLGELIVGWQKVLPEIKAGGKITLYVPPSLGYGAQEIRNQTTGAILIPANSYLKFEIELVDVQ
ncbi:MAG: FKBP-type peptidylprolyl isomerase [Chitinophagaceae bacterium]|nr:MAG: FKBP-type peptidylprolyl isomerase [Chitinophagaceae bacterium]